MDSWKRVMPDFEIKCWNNNSFDFDSVPFTKEALSVKKYAFVADYVRLYALYHEGGIYLDTDVEVYKDFSPLLDCEFFSGTEALDVEGKVHYRMEAAIMGANQEHQFVKDCLDYYQYRHFINQNSSFNENIIQGIITQIGANKYDYEPSNMLQHLQCGITIYPTSYFTNSLISNTGISDQLYAKHCNAASWMDFKDRGKFFHFCRKHDMMGIYHWVEKFKK
jgi:hypothetical protein